MEAPISERSHQPITEQRQVQALYAQGLGAPGCAGQNSYVGRLQALFANACKGALASLERQGWKLDVDGGHTDLCAGEQGSIGNLPGGLARCCGTIAMVAIQFQLSCDPYCRERRQNILKWRIIMKYLTAVIAASIIALTTGLAQARDLGPDEALKLRDAGTILSFEKLNAAALAKHPGGTVHETELEQEYGKYIYQVDLRDAQGVEWDVELDAVTGQVLKDHQDT